MTRWTIRGYANQVKLFLFLLVFFLVMQSTVNFSLLFDARDGLARAARQHARLMARQVAREIPRDQGGHPVTASLAPHLARLARSRKLSEISLMNPAGVVSASSGTLARGGADPDVASLVAEDWRGFSVGREAVIFDVPWQGFGKLVVFQPFLDPGSGRVVALLKVAIPPGDLLTLTRRIRLFAVVQAVGVVAVLLLTFAFIRWMLRPYRQLVRTARRVLPGEATEEQAIQAPGGLVDAFQGVVDTLNRQEQEIETLRQSHTGVADLGGPLFENLPSGVVIIDPQGGVRALNAAGRRTFGIETGVSMGSPYREVLARSDEMIRLIDQCREERQGRSRVLVRVRTDQGPVGHLGASVSPLDTEGGVAAGVLCIFSDLTEIRQIEDRVRLRESLAEVGNLSAGIAHEVRNSLATILGYGRLATRSTAAEAKDHAAAICKEVQSIQAVLDDYLQFARPLSLNLESLDLGGLVQEVVKDLEREGKSPVIEVQGNFGQVEGDEALLRQALGNLLRNALEAAGPEGRVAIHGTLSEDHSQVTVSVQDDGAGLPPGTDPEDLFRPFFTTKQGGTGLGLAMARKTAVYHDGRLEADQGSWGGARFALTLPTTGLAGAAGKRASDAGTF